MKIIIDRIIVLTNEDGFISKLNNLRAKGYQTEWSGNGAICMAKYQEE